MDHSVTATRQLRQVFRALLRRAQRESPRLKVQLQVGKRSEFPAPRDHAYCSSERGRITIVVAPRLVTADLNRQVGVLAHELGHAILFHEGLEQHRERQADEVARIVVGRRVRYDDADVQTLGPGKGVRPCYLPR